MKSAEIKKKISPVVEVMLVYMQPLIPQRLFEPQIDQKAICTLSLFLEHLNLDLLLLLFRRLTQAMISLGDILMQASPIMKFTFGDWRVLMISLNSLVKDIVSHTSLESQESEITLEEYKHLAIEHRYVKELQLIFKAFEPNWKNKTFNDLSSKLRKILGHHHLFEQSSQENLLLTKLVKEIQQIFKVFESNLKSQSFYDLRSQPEKGKILDYHTFEQSSQENLLTNEQREDFKPNNEVHFFMFRQRTNQNIDIRHNCGIPI